MIVRYRYLPPMGERRDGAGGCLAAPEPSYAEVIGVEPQMMEALISDEMLKAIEEELEARHESN